MDMGRALSPEIKAIIYDVAEYFRKRKADKESIEYKTDANIGKIVAEATGYSEKTVRNVTKERRSWNENSGQPMFRSPKKPQRQKKKIVIDDVGLGIIRDKIHQYYEVEKKVPSIGKLLASLRQDGVLTCGREYLRCLLRKMGFPYNIRVKSTSILKSTLCESKDDNQIARLTREAKECCIQNIQTKESQENISHQASQRLATANPAQRDKNFQLCITVKMEHEEEILVEQNDYDNDLPTSYLSRSPQGTVIISPSQTQNESGLMEQALTLSTSRSKPKSMNRKSKTTSCINQNLISSVIIKQEVMDEEADHLDEMIDYGGVKVEVVDEQMEQ